MTTPTLEQMAPNIPPAIREYIDLAVANAVEAARLEAKTTTRIMAQMADKFGTRLGEMEQFERQVRSHLGIYVPE